MGKFKRNIVDIFIIISLMIFFSYLFILLDFVDDWYVFSPFEDDWELDEFFTLILAGLSTIIFFAVYYTVGFKRQEQLPQKTGSTPVSPSGQKDPGQFIAPLYIAGLSILAILLIFAYFITNHAIAQQTHDATIINISGQQRMLSQRIALLTAQLTYPEKRAWAREELRQATDEMEAAHEKLAHGNGVEDILKEQSTSIYSMYFDKNIEYGRDNKRMVSLNWLLHHYIGEVGQILALDDSEMTTNNRLLAHVTNDYHDLLLPLLHDIVNQYEVESKNKVQDLQRIEFIILAITLFVLLLEALFIFAPMVRQVRHQAEALQKRKENEKLTALGKMASGLAHEINNALQPILGLSDVAARQLHGKDEKLEGFMLLIKNSALYAKDVVSNVLEFSGKEENENFKERKAGEVLDEIITFAQSMLPTSVQLVINDPEKLRTMSAIIRCDKTGLTQVIINLFKNAADAMGDKGAITLHVSERLLPPKEAQSLDITAGEYIIIRITDEGCGMDRKTIKNIFDPFFTTKSEGTGLGLSSAYGIMQQHGGTISVSSSPENGTTFTLYLPKHISIKA